MTARQCQQEVTLPEGRGWLTLYATDERQPLAVELSVRNRRGYEAIWRVDSIGMADGRSMREFSYDLVLRSDAEFPVTVAISLDGRPLPTTIFPGPSAGMASPGAIRPIVAITNQPLAIPNLFGHDRMSMTATDAAGAVVATEAIDFPDWDRVRARVDEAWSRLIADQQMRRCVKPVIVTGS